MKLRILILPLLLAAAAAQARPEYLQVFAETYQPKSSLRDLGCKICHTDPPQRNPFGKAVREARTATPLTAAMLHAIDAADSDGDGVSNLDEINAGTPPGVSSKEELTGSQTPGEGPIPNHAFHPVLVHFPIALFLFGAFMELFGWKRNEADMRKAGWWCLLAGALSSLAAVATGLTSFFLKSLEMSGPVLIHFGLAVSAVVMMLATVAWRRQAAHTSTAYFGMLVVTAVLVGVAGHFGGQLVFGS